MRISVIVPVLDEEATIGPSLDALDRSGAHEILVVDGGSRDKTRETAAARRSCALLSSERGRARQMNAGAAAATGDVLVFLHADCRLGPGALDRVAAALRDESIAGGAFRVRLDRRGLWPALVSLGINARSELLRSATGDQAIFVRRAAFVASGGFPDIPLLEDVAFWRRLRASGRLVILGPRVTASARRWVADGYLRTCVRMWRIRLRFVLGASPEALKKTYREVR